MSWSSGKDSAFALDAVRSAGAVEVTGLLTTVNAEAGRVAMHAVRRELLEAQSDAIGLALHVVDLPSPCPNEVYERLMRAALENAKAEGVTRVVFGDLFLEDVRRYREASLAGSGVEPMFPLWGRPTRPLAEEMVERGLRAVITCVDPAQAPAGLAGRWYDAGLLRDLPAGVDPCGENGELHTFVAYAPGFSRVIDVLVGEVVERDGFVFADLCQA
ncbi:MAG: ATP-binding protein [Acidimicrobiales bacterium]